MQSIRILALVALLAPSAFAGETVHLFDAATPVPDDGSVQVRTVGGMSAWMVAPGDDAPAGGEVLRARDGELLYLVREHGAPEAGRVLAAWDGFRVVAITPEEARFHHCAERLGWLRPAPKPDFTPIPTLERGVDPALRASIIDEVDLTRYTDGLRRLSGNLPTVDGDPASTVATRWTYSDGDPAGIDLATAYLISELEAMGYTVVEQVFAMPEPFRTARNLLAIREGNTSPDEVVVVGAHYDAISEIPAVSAPGAEDNASGTSAVLELARVFSDAITERSVHFICFGGEEQGLYGSRHYVDELGTNGWTVVGAYTMDMIAAWNDDFGVLIEGNTPSQPIMDELRDSVIELGAISWDYSFNPFGSDHIPFIQAGLPALLAIDLDWASYAPYHTSGDTFSQVDPTLGHEITRAIAGAVADVAVVVGATDVGDDVPGPGRATSLALADPYPNPFNPRTVITFALPRDGAASLRVHDARGRVVRRLLDGSQAAGRQSVVWNGEDDNGRPVASGMYFVRLEHEEQVKTRRAVLVR